MQATTKGFRYDQGRQHQQCGAVAIEFIATFILLLVIAYGLVAYSLPLLLKATYEEMAAQGLREAIALEFGEEGDIETVMSRTWLPSDWRQPCYDNGFMQKHADNSISVCLRLSNPESIIPVINLFGLKIPSLPSEIRGEAHIQLYDAMPVQEN